MRPLLSLLGILCAIAVAGPAAAEEDSVFSKGGREVGLAAGYAWGFGALGSQHGDTEHADFVMVSPRVGLQLSDPLGGDAWYRGSVEGLIEATFIASTHPRGGNASGALVNFRYNFLSLERVVPFIEGGGGMMNLDFGLVDQRDGFNFQLQASGGLHWMWRPRIALTGLYRYYHISNAKTRLPNLGINNHVLMVGMTLFAK